MMMIMSRVMLTTMTRMMVLRKQCQHIGGISLEGAADVGGDAEAAALAGGKATMSKMEQKIRELEIELGSTQSRTSEAGKGYLRSERMVKELSFQSEEDKKNQERMSDLANKLQQKIKTYKQHIEEAEEIAALNLAKFRKAQQELEEVEDRSKIAKESLATQRLTLH